MTEAAAKDALLGLVQSAVAAALEAARPLSELRGAAHFSSERDGHLTHLQTFQGAIEQIVGVPHFVERFGVDAAERVCLQFAYEYFERVEYLSLDPLVFDAVWSDLIAELRDLMWTMRGLANVTHFASDTLVIPLGDGVSVRSRNFDELASLGFSASVLERLREDCGRPGASSFVLIVEHTSPKSPTNLISQDLATPWTKAVRALGALRLIADGDVGMSAMWVARPARFNLVLGGVETVGVSLPNGGRPTSGRPRPRTITRLSMRHSES